MDHQALNAIAEAMVADGKGILAADESTGTCTKRFEALGIASTEENRRRYREVLFTTPGGADYISGVILYDETLRQATSDGALFPTYLAAQGMIPGIKVDTGAKDLAGHPDEKVTQGLDGLAERLAEYHALGARFAKWRGVITIGDAIPSRFCIEANAHALARYAALCQQAGIVPIVEPEVLMDANNSIERCYEVTALTQRLVFDQLRAHGVYFGGMLLKPNMVISGKGCATQAGVEQVAAMTVACLKDHVPASVPGVVFLSGGQSDQLATAHLDAMNRFGDLPWKLSFSYGRALQQPALHAWKGDESQVQAAQRELHKRARLNGLAAVGGYDATMESDTA
jgi:fructose-bisphosphate aldolase, class I